MGINTSFADFAGEKDEHDKLFVEAVADLYKVEPDSVVLTSGASEAIFLVYSVLGTGGKAFVPLPNYEPIFTLPRSLGMEVRASLLAKSNARGAVYGFSDPNNPTAKSLEPGLLEKLRKTAKRNASTLYLNETYKEFTFPGKPVSYFQLHDDVVTCSTMTKFYGLGRLRVGWILADKRRASRLWDGKRLVSGHDSEYSLWLSRQVLRKRARFVKRAREIWAENTALMSKFINDIEGAAETSLGDAPFCLVRYRNGPDSTSFCRRLLQKTGVLVAPGDYFGAPKAFRLCFTCDGATLRQGLEHLSDYLKTTGR
jgi:aspartate/methionine/tyrosine aminotransferase